MMAQDTKLKPLQKQKKITDKPSAPNTETGGANSGKGNEPQAWKDKHPNFGKNPQKKVVEGEQFRFCKFHNDGKGKWVQHAAEKCKLNPMHECCSGKKKADKTETPENSTVQASGHHKQIKKLAIIEQELKRNFR